MFKIFSSPILFSVQDHFLCINTSSKDWTKHSFKIFSTFFFSPKNVFYRKSIHFLEVFVVKGIEESVQCSELGGVHYIEVQSQQKQSEGEGGEGCVH